MHNSLASYMNDNTRKVKSVLVIVILIEVNNPNQRQGRLVDNGVKSNCHTTNQNLGAAKEVHHQLRKRILIM